MAERERRQGKLLAIAAVRQAELTARAVGGGRLPEVWEAFPFWTEEEVRELRIQKYRAIMERHAAQFPASRGTEGNNRTGA